MASQKWWTRVDRDIILFTAGLTLTIFISIVEVLGSGPEHPSLLVLFAGMMGLPTAIRYDKRRKSRKDHDGNG